MAIVSATLHWILDISDHYMGIIEVVQISSLLIPLTLDCNVSPQHTHISHLVTS